MLGSSEDCEKGLDCSEVCRQRTGQTQPSDLQVVGERAGGHLAYSVQFNGYVKYLTAYLSQACPTGRGQETKKRKELQFCNPRSTQAQALQGGTLR